MNLTPEQKTRLSIDIALEAGLGVAGREATMATGLGFTDYLLFVNRMAVGGIEAKPAGHTLSGVELQSSKYAAVEDLLETQRWKQRT